MAFKHYLFDWGDTLMVDQPGNPVPMCEWEEVHEVEGAKEILSILNENAYCHLATNSVSSSEQQIRKALIRAGLNRFITNVYCYRRLGLEKPSQEFFDYILRDLGANRSEVVMIGDGLEKDVIGALDSGIQAIWYNPRGMPVPDRVHSINSLLDLSKIS